MENIGSNKINAIFGRLEIKDYIDLYSIVTQTKYTFDELFGLARQKDLGLSEFYFANAIADISQIQTWPDLKVDLNKQAMFNFYKKLTTDLLLKIKPEDV